MIEFNGYITGKAQKQFARRTQYFTRVICVFTELVMLPTTLWITLGTNNYFFLKIYLTVAVVLTIAMFVPPQSKKTMKQYTPRNICLREEYITCVTDKGVESKLIEKAKRVYDYGEFYEIDFPIGNFSPNFICQKNLLVVGTLEEFEKKFKDKIIRKY